MYYSSSGTARRNSQHSYFQSERIESLSSSSSSSSSLSGDIEYLTRGDDANEREESISFLLLVEEEEQKQLHQQYPEKKERDRFVNIQEKWIHSSSSWWDYHLLPHGPWKVGNEIVMDAMGVKLLKFCGCAFMSLLLVHYYAIFADADRDKSYGLREMILFDSNNIIFDVVVFFVIGRFYEDTCPSVDTLRWILPSIGTALLQSYLASNSTSLHHSITLHDMYCFWSWQFWVLIICGAIPVLVLLVMAHLVHAAKKRATLQKILEFVLAVVIFFLPYTGSYSSFFHLHHWYYALVLGMHANAHDQWWSRITQCICFGIYINGVAIYGRDPVMTCALTQYQSHAQQCPYLTHDNSNTSWDTVFQTALSSKAQHWQNCESRH